MSTERRGRGPDPVGASRRCPSGQPRPQLVPAVDHGRHRGRGRGGRAAQRPLRPGAPAHQRDDQPYGGPRPAAGPRRDRRRGRGRDRRPRPGASRRGRDVVRRGRRRRRPPPPPERNRPGGGRADRAPPGRDPHPGTRGRCGPHRAPTRSAGVAPGPARGDRGPAPRRRGPGRGGPPARSSGPWGGRHDRDPLVASAGARRADHRHARHGARAVRAEPVARRAHRPRLGTGIGAGRPRRAIWPAPSTVAEVARTAARRPRPASWGPGRSTSASPTPIER